MRLRHVLPAAGALALLGLVQAPQSAAREIHYGAIDHPRLNACDALSWRGREEEAGRCYRELVSATGDPVIGAEAFWALGDIKSANTLFQEAVKARPEDPVARLRWGGLFMETYQYQDALDLFNEALAIDPDNAYARVGAASALAETFEADAMKYLEPVLKDGGAPAGARFQARLLLARMAMESTDMDKAVAILREAEEIAATAKLPPLEIYGYYAAMDLLGGKADSAWIQKGLDMNPRYGDIYAIPGHFFWISRRYREAVELFRQAVDVQPEHWIAHMELGINLLRNNDVSGARRHLEIAYGGDPYNPKTVNTLRLLDTFDQYDLISSPRAAPGQAPAIPSMIFRLHRDESEVLIPYAERLAEQGIREFSQRYEFEPREPVVIEIYPHHDDFVVRTIGMPGVGILGATFGYVFAMDSPSDHPDNEYHWGTTLWHELAHVFTLEVTDHLIPRWFSEGISVFEEWRNGPIPGIRIPFNVYQAMAGDKFLPIAELDGGFIRPTYPQQVIVSYMQAGLICEYIERRYGFGRINDLLSEFRRGAETADAIESVLGIAPSAFDKGFKAYVEETFGGLLGQLDAWKALLQDAARNMGESDWEGAIAQAARSVEIYPDYVESDSPYIILARAYAETGDKDGELKVLREYWQRGGYAPRALWLLARRLYGLHRVDEAVAVLEDVNYVAPFDPELHATLGDWMIETDRHRDALNEYEIALAMQPHDLAAAYYRVARANHLLERSDQARKYLLSALEIAPHYRPAQKLLLETTQPPPQP